MSWIEFMTHLQGLLGMPGSRLARSLAADADADDQEVTDDGR